MCLYPCGTVILAWTRTEGKERRERMSCALGKVWRVGSWRWSLYKLFTVFPEYWPAHRLVLFQIGGVSPGTGVQMCADNPSLYLSPSRSVSLSLSSSPLTSLPRTDNEKKHAQQDEDESHIVHRAEFGRPQIRDSGRLVMIRGSGWVMGSKDDHLFPSLIQGGKEKRDTEAQRGFAHPICKT